MTRSDQTFQAVCHCGGVELELFLPDGIVGARRCDCSLCRRRGAVMASVVADNLKIVRGQELLALYQFHTKTAEHYFCSVCGIYTHHRTRIDPGLYGFNVGCLEPAADLSDLAVENLDGVNHPADAKPE